MENKKILQINCATCDVRNVTEELLSTYKAVRINAAALITSPESQALLGRFGVAVNAANNIHLERDVRFSMVNGPLTLSKGQAVPEEKLAVLVNAPLTIESGCEEQLKAYTFMCVNGPVSCPESAVSLLSSFSINGPIRAYPDGAILLQKTTELDRFFHLRAKQDALYYAASKVVALAPDINFSKLAEKNVRFATKKLLVSESLAEAAVPLFDEKTDIVVLPDGFAYVNDDAELDEALVKRYGGKLFINGSLTVGTDAAKALDQVAALRVGGDLLVCRSLKDRVLAVDVEYEDLYVLGGVLIRDRPGLEITASMLEDAADGVSVMDCAHVSIDSGVEPELLREKLVGIANCASVVCATREQVGIVQALGRNVAAFTLSYEVAEEAEEGENEDVVKINAAFYTL